LGICRKRVELDFVPSFLLSSNANSYAQEGSRDESAAVTVLVLCSREFQELVVELLFFSVLLRRFESVHCWAVKSSE